MCVIHNPRRLALKTDVSTVLAGDEVSSAFAFYEERFAGLRTAALQRHLMTMPEFHFVCTDSGVEKWRVFTETGDLVALATYTNILTSMPLIEPAYFEVRWPELYAEGRIWYCGFVAVAADAPAATFLRLIYRMFTQALGKDGRGVISLDYCTANNRLAGKVSQTLSGFAGNAHFNNFVAVAADQQTYWTYGPAPTGGGFR